MDFQVLVRGQSNAIFFMELDRYAGATQLISEVHRLLGFDGVTDKVNILYNRGDDARSTAFGGTAFIGDWVQRDLSGAWQPTGLELSMLRSAAELDNPAAAATSVLWLHSEYDSRRADLTVEEWTSAVRYDAALLRGTLAGDAASIPYHFVSAHPYGYGSAEGHQVIRAGMEVLAADPTFNARIAARALDINASLDNEDGNDATTEYGRSHITADDALLIATRAARTIAEDWAAYAKPGSPVALAGGDIADVGPRVLSATLIGPDTLRLLVAQDATGGFAALDPDAASGLGWAVSGTAAAPVAARSAVVQGPNTIDLAFTGALPANGMLHYGWGYGRLAERDAPGQGNAITDLSGLPIWTPVEGIMIGAPAVENGSLWLQ